MDSKLKWLFVAVVGIIVVFFIALSVYKSRPLTRDECYRLGSNDRTLLCLNELVPSPAPNRYLPDTLLHKILITKSSMSDDFLSITVENVTGAVIKDIVLKVTLSEYKNTKCNNNILDTKYVVLNQTFLKGDTVSMQKPIFTAIDRYCWNVSVKSAIVP